MCCDGSLFARGRIDPSKRAHWESQGLDCFGDEDAAFFLQACSCLDRTACTLFESGRPEICAAFRCEPLRLLEDGRCDPERAQATIRDALAIRDDVVHAAQSAGLRYRSFLELKDELARAFLRSGGQDSSVGAALVALARFHEFTEAHILPDDTG